ncbi:MAG: DUF2214 domain-containing protein [Bauldia sp.]|nr:DUF2214 domain-containing protein [Bauldia sp.]MCW5718182.1 DUF2214 domain-containing protein [Bauldia sp.]
MLVAVAEPASAQVIDDWLAALRDWRVAEQLRLSFYAYPIVNTLHILGFALLIGGIVLVDLRLLGLFARTPVTFFGRILEPMAIVGLLLAATAGFLLFVVKPLDYAENPSFLVKMGLIAAGIVNGVTQRFGSRWRVAMNEGVIAPSMRVQAFLSLVIWTAALFAGRFIAFLE